MTVYFGAAVVAMFLVPVVSRLAKRYRLVDAPGPRKVHQIAVPRIGGLVFVFAVYAVVLPVFFLNSDIGRSFRAEQTKYIVLLIIAAFVFVVGLIDDLCSVRASIKLLCLVGASLAVCALGATIDSISVGPWFELELGLLAWPLAVVWIITITVGMNFIDGLDGLAGGVAAIVCSTITLMAFWNDQVAMGVLMLALLGSVTGFLFFNFHPAKVFMGDGGAMFLGFMIGAGSLVCQAKTSTVVGLAFPVLVLGVPILDAGFTVIRRGILWRRSIFAAERGHLHHRLLDMGLRQRTVVIVIYAVTVVSASIGVFMLTVPDGWSLGLLAGGLVFLLAVFTCLGAARIRETIAATRRILEMSREKKEEKGCFEDAQLRMREAMSLGTWWESACVMAEQMQFQRMEFCLHDNGHPEATYEWGISEDEYRGSRTAEFILPLHENGVKTTSKMKISVRRNGSLEVACRRVALLGRLMDEFPPPEQEPEGTAIQPGAQVEFVRECEGAGSLVSVTDRHETKGPVGIPMPISIMGVPVVPFESYDQALECIERAVESGKKTFWVTVNPQKCYRAWHEHELMDVLKQADVGICDGVGVSLASRILHGRKIDRCTGCDLFFRTLSLASKKHWCVFLLGASAESNSVACTNLQEMYPDLRIVGRHDEYFKDSSVVIEQINASQADLLFVGMGSPRQEQWIWRHREAVDAAFCMGVGGSFEVAAGNLRRAPKVFLKTGTEFLFRLITEPRKRWPRQRVYFPFMFRVIGKRLFGSAMPTVAGDDLTKH